MRTLPQQVVSLIHYVELSNSGWWEETTDRCVVGILWLIKDPAPVSKIRKEIFNELGGLDLKSGEITESIARLVASEQVLDLHDGRYKLSLACTNSLSEQVKKQ